MSLLELVCSNLGALAAEVRAVRWAEPSLGLSWRLCLELIEREVVDDYDFPMEGFAYFDPAALGADAVSRLQTDTRLDPRALTEGMCLFAKPAPNGRAQSVLILAREVDDRLVDLVAAWTAKEDRYVHPPLWSPLAEESGPPSSAADHRERVREELNRLAARTAVHAAREEPTSGFGG